MDITFAQAVERWHDFYITLATVVGALIGFLAVAVSIKVDLLADAHVFALKYIARQTFVSLICILLIALAFLIPDLSHEALGLVFLVFSVLGGVWTIFNGIFTFLQNRIMEESVKIALPETAKGTSEHPEPKSIPRQNAEEVDVFASAMSLYCLPTIYLIFQFICYVVLVPVALLIRSAQISGLYWVVVVIALMGVGAMVSSWSLLSGLRTAKRFVSTINKPSAVPPLREKSRKDHRRSNP